MKLIKERRKLKDTLLKIFLAVSIIFSVFVVSNCDFLTNFLDDLHGNGGPPPPDFGSDAKQSYATTLFKLVGETALKDAEGEGIGWAMSAIGLSESSPDYTEQLDKIDQDLQVIISQLNGLDNELINIESELKVINCSTWQTTLKDERSAVDNLIYDYQTYVAAAENGKPVMDKIADWVDRVLAIGDHTDLEPMGVILAAFSSQLVGPSNTGLIPACVQSVPSPAEFSFGTDTVYYKIVNSLIDYYYVYQVRALFLYSEAWHYQAWLAAGSPNSDFLSADSVSNVCSDINIEVNCDLVAGRTNNLYNALIDQFTAAGEGYSDENLVQEYSASGSSLWPLSLEDFTTAAGDHCADPLNSANPCGTTVGWFNIDTNPKKMSSVTYKGYKGWIQANSDNLTELLAGWNSGTAGNYLQNNLGFKNMRNKIILSPNVVEINLDETGATQYVVPFFDTNWSYNFLPGAPAISTSQFASLLTKSRHKGNLCNVIKGIPYVSVDYTTNSNVPANRNGYYNAVGHNRHCGSDYNNTTPFSFSVLPGYLAQQNGVNWEPSGLQFRWPVLNISKQPCTENRSSRNAGGVWTKCGDDFTAYLDFNVPRPATCDNTASGSTCKFSLSTIKNARRLFGKNLESKSSL